jgi:PAS domain S-box-containing protein
MSRGELIDALCAADRQPSAENVRLLHDLQVHQVELEMQNKQLRDAQEHLEESRARYADLFDLAPVAYCVFDRNGAIEDSNVAAATLLRMNRSAMIGLPFSRAVMIAEKQTFADHIARCLDEELRVTTELTVEVRGRGEMVLQLVSTPLASAPSGRVRSCRTVLVDVTRLKRSEGMFRFLASANEALAASLDVAATLSAVAKSCVPTLADACFIDVCDEREEESPLRRAEIVLAVRNADAMDVLRRQALDTTWRRYESQLVKTLTPVFEPASAAALGAEVEVELDACALLLLPLVGRGRTLGVLGAIMTHSARTYTLQDFELAQDIVRRAAIALDNAFSYERIHARTVMRRSSPLPPPLDPSRRGRPVVMIVDRDVESRAAIRDTLMTHGYAVIDAPDTESSLRYLRSMAIPPAAIIADEQAMDTGATLSEAFRASRLIVIGQKTRGGLAEALGAVASFERPIPLDQLLKKLDD